MIRSRAAATAAPDWRLATRRSTIAHGVRVAAAARGPAHFGGGREGDR